MFGIPQQTRVIGKILIIVKEIVEYSGTKKVISREDCLSGITTGTTVDVCY